MNRPDIEDERGVEYIAEPFKNDHLNQPIIVDGSEVWGKGKGDMTKEQSAINLLEQFAALYGEVPLQGSMIETALKLWRDYYEFSGDHMIFTEEGWEPGEAKQSYLEDWAKNPEWSNPILDEVNAPEATRPVSDSRSSEDEMRIARSAWWDAMCRRDNPVTASDIFPAFESGWKAREATR